MAFLSRNRNDEELSQAAAPLLKQIASVESSELRGADKDFEELVKIINPSIQNEKFDRESAVESMELLNNFALLEKSIDPLMKFGIVDAIANLLEHENNQNEEELSKKNQLGQHERLVGAALNHVNRLLSSPQAIKNNIYEKLLQKNVISDIMKLLKNKPHLKNLVKNNLIAAVNKYKLIKLI